MGRLVVALVVLGSAAPIIAYWAMFGRVATVTPAEAKHHLRRPDSGASLVDVRPEEEFAAGHIDGALSWPLPEILAVRGADELPAWCRGRSLLLLCRVGLDSRLAARHLQHRDVPRVCRVRGGIQEWIRSAAIEQPPRPPPTDGRIREWLEQAPAPEGAAFDRWRVGLDQVVELPFRRSPIAEQVAAVVAYFVLKPIYMLLALVWAARLWNRRSGDLVALRWGMLFFFLGEAACAVNYFGYRETSYLWDYLHGQGMLLSFAFVTYAVLDGFDRRVLGLSALERRCAALPLCGACVKFGQQSCGLRRMFHLIIPALMVVALMLPTADWQDTSYNTLIFGSVYNYAHLRVQQQYENVVCAVAALVLLGASLLALVQQPGHTFGLAKATFAGGVGALGFGMFRLLLGAAFDQNRVWFLFWEETTELVFIVGVGVVLGIFRRSLVDRVESAVGREA
jgi:rhodanese-related sulfurtransferase